MGRYGGKTLLITGGTGSFGNAVLDRLLRSDIREVRVFSRDEKKQDDMRNTISDGRVKYYIGDVRSLDSVRHVMHGVDYVFHAAALKQVPSCEFFPLEAVRTNVLGTSNVLDAAIASGVEKVVCLSTDKAVYPINAMGMTKALMEKLAASKTRMGAAGDTVITVTRYGNVMCSRGSVIPLFVHQLQHGLPLTVTNPEMTRFMMSLDDAIDLVEYAFAQAQGGELFVQKAPAATIGDLVEAVRRILGSTVSDIHYIGTRHGEKLYESLLTREEMSRADDLGGYFRVPIDGRDLNYGNYFVNGNTSQGEADDYTSHNTTRLSLDALEALVRDQQYVREALGFASDQRVA